MSEALQASHISSLLPHFDVIGCISCIVVNIDMSPLPPSPTVSLSRLRCAVIAPVDLGACDIYPRPADQQGQGTDAIPGARSSPVSCENLIAWRLRG